jgi:hypothetical protein
MLGIDSAQASTLTKAVAASPPRDTTRSDTAQVNWLNKQAFILRINHAAQTRRLAKQALRLAQRLTTTVAC